MLKIFVMVIATSMWLLAFEPLNTLAEELLHLNSNQEDCQVSFGEEKDAHLRRSGAGALEVGGDLSVTGQITLSGDPTSPLQAATRQCVDNSISDYAAENPPVTLDDSVESESTTTAASSLAVKTAYDLANAALPKTSVSNSTSSDSDSTAASSSSLKQVYDMVVAVEGKRTFFFFF